MSAGSNVVKWFEFRDPLERGWIFIPCIRRHSLLLPWRMVNLLELLLGVNKGQIREVSWWEWVVWPSRTAGYDGRWRWLVVWSLDQCSFKGLAGIRLGALLSFTQRQMVAEDYPCWGRLSHPALKGWSTVLGPAGTSGGGSVVPVSEWQWVAIDILLLIT
jgi:hypothetical protein